MNLPLRLTECSHPISWVSVGISRNVCWYFAECFVCISLVFVGFSRCVRCIIADRQQHFRKPFAAVGVRFIVPANTYTPTKWGTNARLRGYAPLYPLPIIIALSFQLDSVETHLFRRYVCSELIRPRNALAPIIIYGKGVNN